MEEVKVQFKIFMGAKAITKIISWSNSTSVSRPDHLPCLKSNLVSLEVSVPSYIIEFETLYHNKLKEQ